MTDRRLGTPFYLDSGEGSGIVCLHSNASTSGQWRPLIQQLSPDFRVLAPDTLGAGRSPEWPTDREVALRDEAALQEPVFAAAGDPFSLVGHSYGGAVALIAALEDPGRISKMVLYEPTLFSLLAQESPGHPAFVEINTVGTEAAEYVAAGDHDAAAERFIDYWMGVGSWAATPEKLRETVAASMVNVKGWGNALMHDPTPLESFRSINIPVLLLLGELSPASSRGVARLLTSTLPNVEVVEIDGIGHMAPVTHPQVVNDLIVGFLT